MLDVVGPRWPPQLPPPTPPRSSRTRPRRDNTHTGAWITPRSAHQLRGKAARRPDRSMKPPTRRGRRGVSNELSNDRSVHPRTPTDSHERFPAGQPWIDPACRPMNLASGRRGRRFKSSHPDPGQRPSPIAGDGLLLARTVAKYSSGYEPSCLPSRLRACKVLACLPRYKRSWSRRSVRDAGSAWPPEDARPERNWSPAVFRLRRMWQPKARSGEAFVRSGERVPGRSRRRMRTSRLRRRVSIGLRFPLRDSGGLRVRLQAAGQRGQ